MLGGFVAFLTFCMLTGIRMKSETKNKKRYDDWRLPTQEEINSIVEFQNDKKAANTMDRVLKGYYYWTANGGKSNKVPGSNINNYPGAVRCIRDLSPAEVQELENNLK